jgi:anti-anti-sigma factor
LVPAEELFAVRLESRNGIQRLFLIGALDRVSVALFRHEVDGFSLEDALIVDLRYLAFLDMTGLRAIDGFLQRTVRPGSQAHLVNATARVRATFVAAGKGRLLNPDATAAVVDLSGVEPWARAARRMGRTMHPARLTIDETIDG